MPLLTIDELQERTGLFRGRCGEIVARSMMRLFSVDDINELYDDNASFKGPAFASAVLSDIGVRYEIRNQHVLDNLPYGPFITISNHPYGGIDGIILVDIFGHLRKDYKVMANSFLGRIRTMEDSFILVTPTGEERTEPAIDSIRGIRHAMQHLKDGHPLGLFPAGAVSDFSLKDMTVRDREWQDAAVRLIARMKVPVLPVKFIDRNSDFYYSLGLIDWKVRLLRLPAEVFNKRNKTVRVTLGEVIGPDQMAGMDDMEGLKRFLRSSVYDLK